MNELPEAPLSINIGSYYKGFYVGWTKRSADPEVSDKVDQIKKFVDALVEAGYEPSWNKKTSEEALHPDPIMGATKDVVTPITAPLGVCPKCHAPNTTYKSGKVGCSKYCWRTNV